MIAGALVNLQAVGKGLLGAGMDGFAFVLGALVEPEVVHVGPHTLFSLFELALALAKGKLLRVHLSAKKVHLPEDLPLPG